MLGPEEPMAYALHVYLPVYPPVGQAVDEALAIDVGSPMLSRKWRGREEGSRAAE